MVPSSLSFSVSRWWSPTDSATAGSALDSVSVNYGFDNLGLSDADRRSLFPNAETMDAFEEQPDCLRSSLLQEMPRCDDILWSDEQRSKLAVKMTLCGIKSFPHHQIPMECDAIVSQTDSLSTNARTKDYQRCLNAISRNGQLSGPYLSNWQQLSRGDATKLCFALRNGDERDAVSELYRNITKEKVSLIRWMNVRQELDEENRALWHSLSAGARSLLESLQNSMDTAGDFSSLLSAKFQRNLDEVLEIARRRSEEDRVNGVMSMATELDLATKTHTEDLASVASGIQAAMSSQMNVWSAQMLDVFHGLTSRTDEVALKVYQMGSDVDVLAQTIVQLSSSASEVSEHLDASTEQAQRTVLTLTEVSRSSELLTQSLEDAHMQAQEQLRNINETAGMVIENMLRSSSVMGFMTVRFDSVCVWATSYEEHCRNFMNRWDIWALQCAANFALGLTHSIVTISNQSLGTALLLIVFLRFTFFGWMFKSVFVVPRMIHSSLQYVCSAATTPGGIRRGTWRGTGSSRRRRRQTYIRERFLRPIGDDDDFGVY